MEGQLGYKEARELASKIRSKLSCDRALAAALNEESTRVPRADQKSTVTCLLKAVDGTQNVNCAVVDGSPCPLLLPTNIIDSE